MKNFNRKEYYTDFGTRLFSTVYTFDNPDDQLAMLSKLILHRLDRHAPLERTKVTRAPVPWKKQLVLLNFKKQRDKYRFLADKIPSKENWANFRNARNKLKKKISSILHKSCILQDKSNNEKFKRKLLEQLQNCSPYLKPKQQNTRGR